MSTPRREPAPSDEPIDLVAILCPDCGPGFAPLDVVRLRVNVETTTATLSFPCTVCGVRSALRVSPSSVDKLVHAGIAPVYWSLPPELLEDSRSHFVGQIPHKNVRQLGVQLVEDIEAHLRNVANGLGS